MPSRTNQRLVGPRVMPAWGVALMMSAAGLVLLSSASASAGFDELEPRERTPASEKLAARDKIAPERVAPEKAAPERIAPEKPSLEKMTAPLPGKAGGAEKAAAPQPASKGPVPQAATQPGPVAPPPAAVAPAPAVKVAPPPPDQSWLQDVPEKPGARSRGKAAVFVIRGDDYYQPVRAAVVKTLRRRGLNVTASLRPVDSPAQYREMSQTLQLGVFIEGEMRGEGARQTAQIRLRSGVSGRPIATATFTGPTKKIVGEVGEKLWTRMGPAIARSCATASRQRRPVRAPMRIEAGEAEDSPISMRGI